MKGVRSEKRIPEEALANLELLERIVRGGEKNGMPTECTAQI